jgi:serine/threonine protein kinase
MVRGDGYVKVLDFGLARLVFAPAQFAWENSGRPKLPDDAGDTAGNNTLNTLSPEQARGKTVGTHTDIFSLGVVLYEVATGRHPFAADSQVGVLHAVLSPQSVMRPSNGLSGNRGAVRFGNRPPPRPDISNESPATAYPLPRKRHKETR